MTKKIAILQSNYIPWKGYFDLIASVDEFIFYDEMQYTKNDWRNRNKIKTPNGLQWLSIPVDSKGRMSKKINEVEIIDENWAQKHWKTLKQNYSKSKYFKVYRPIFEDIYSRCSKENLLCSINYIFIEEINKILGINTKLSFSHEYGLIEGKTERLVDLVLKSSGTEYISGPSAKDYIDVELFKKSNIKLTWMDYSEYKEYPQLFGNFEHGVTILDLLFNCGKDAVQYLKMKI